MPKFVVFEVWTMWRVVEGESEQAVYDNAENDPKPRPGMSLCNWHVVAVDDKPEEKPTGALNYQQVD